MDFTFEESCFWRCEKNYSNMEIRTYVNIEIMWVQNHSESVIKTLVEKSRDIISGLQENLKISKLVVGIRLD